MGPSDSVSPDHRCAVHGLAVSDDGRCVLCRRASQTPAPKNGIWRVVSVAILIAAAVGIGAKMRAAPPPHEAPVVATPAAPAAAPAPPTAAPAQPEVIEEREQPAEESSPDPDPAPPSETAPSAPPVEVAAPAEPTPPVDDIVLRGRQRRETEERQARLAEALRRVRITLYTTSWCGVCAQTKAWLSEQQLAYTELDIEKDAAAREACLRINPRASIPTVDIEGQILVGFSERRMAEAIARAAKRYLGR